MIIGISGKKQHGKDTVANIIQYLIFNKRYPGHSHNLKSFSEEAVGWKYLESGWDRKQFAGKLKRVVALLIGCEVRDLEDNKFKETPLSDQWNVYYLAHARNEGRIGKLYYSQEELEDSLNPIQRVHVKVGDLELVREQLTPRRLLQLMGTEAGRDIIHPNIWVNALMAEYRAIGSDKGIEKYWPNWIVTDVRFPNEAQAIKDRGGILVRVNRPLMELVKDEHESETALDNYKNFDFWIRNGIEGGIDVLVKAVENILFDLQILK